MEVPPCPVVRELMSSRKVPARRVPTRRLHALMASSALGCSLVVLASGGPVAAQDACGPVVNGRVVCAPGTYPAVRYQNAVDIEVVIEAGVTVTDETYISGSGNVVVTADPGAILADIALDSYRDGRVSLTAGDTGYISAQGSEGGSSINVRDVTGGIEADADGLNGLIGDVEVKARHVTSEYGYEIVFVEYARDATINIESVKSVGPEVVRSGIYGWASRDLSITVKSVEIDHLADVDGDEISAAIYGVAGNKLVIDVGSLEVGLLDSSENNNATAVFASADIVEIGIDSLSAVGEAGTAGIYVFANDTAKIETGSITFGGGGAALYVEGTADATVTSGALAATGGAKGIVLINSGDQTVTSTTITTAGDNAHGIDLSGARGAVNVTGGSITSVGDGVRGITVADVEGPVTIGSTTISATGFESRGIYVDAEGGAANPIIINGGNITVAGQFSQGIQAYADAATNVRVTGSVTATGEETIGVQILNDGVTVLDLGVITVDGNASTGIEVFDDNVNSAGADITIGADSLRVLGDNAQGVRVRGDEVVIDLDDLQVSGDDSIGVELRSGDARTVNLTIDNANVTGNGSSLATVYADERITADLGVIRIGEEADASILLSSVDVTATVRDMESLSPNGGGVAVEATGAGTLNIGRLKTVGDHDGGDGPRAAASVTAGGDVVVGHVPNADGSRGGRIETTGSSMRGLDLRSTAGTVTATLASISTEGVNASGVRARTGEEGAAATDALVKLDIGSIKTKGAGALGVDVIARNADIKLGAATTEGTRSSAVVLRTEGAGAVRVEADSITTTSLTTSRGLQIGGGGGEPSQTAATVVVGSVTTSGFESVGIDVDAATADVTVNSVTTAGVHANGVNVNAATMAKVTSAGTIWTKGERAIGVNATAEAANGSANIDVGTVLTDGLMATGVYASAATVNILADVVTTKGRTAEAVAVSASGDVTLDLGVIRAEGEGSRGVFVEASGDVIMKAVSVHTTAGVYSGESPHAVTLTTTGGDITASAGTIGTTGDGAYALSATTADGVIKIDVGAVETAGIQADGVVAASAGVIGVEADQVRVGGSDSVGVRVENAGSDVTVDLGNLTATGLGGRGVIVSAAGDVNLAAQSIRTTGEASESEVSDAVDLATGAGDITVVAGTIATAGNDARALRAASLDGLVSLDVGTIETAGVDANGIVASTGGQIIIDAGTVTTTGADAIGIDASSGGTMEISADVMSGRSTLVNATSGGDMAITLGRAREAGAGPAVRAQSGGDLTVNVTNELSSTGGAAADLDAEGFIDFTVAQGAVVHGDDVGLRMDSGAGTHLIIGGTVSADAGLALDIKGGAATIDNNANTILGRIDLTANDDVLNNAGRFTAHGTSDFGAGTDVVNNTGIIDMGESDARRSAVFANLERLNNAGVIDLSNGVAGDVFAISGILNGRAGNSVAMDLDLTGAPLADRIVAGGFEGVTEVLLNVEGSGRLGDTGVVIAESGRTQTGAEIEIEVVGGGFVDYSLVLSGNAFTLQGDLAPPAFEPTKIAAGAQHQWTSGADMVSARFEQMRDGGVGEGQGVQVWSQTFYGSVDIEANRSFEIEDETMGADLTHEVKSRGVQAGIDQTVGDVTFGVLAGTGRTELRFRNGDRTRYDGLGLGVYGHWSRGPLSVGGVAKMDSFDLDHDWAEAGVRSSADGSTVGARFDVAWRASVGESWYLEPQGSLSWSDTSLGSIDSDAGGVDFGDTRSLVGRIGFRAGGTVAMTGGMTLRPYGGLHVLNEFEGNNASQLHLGDQLVQVRDKAHDAWARATLGANFGGTTGLAGFLQAEQDLGPVEGFTARAGIRYAW